MSSAGHKSSSPRPKTLLSLLILAICVVQPARAQMDTAYQRAKTPLRAVSVGMAKVHTLPSTGAPIIAAPPPGAEVVVSGRQGNWFEVQIEQGDKVLRGWLQATELKVLGPMPVSPPVGVSPGTVPKSVAAPKEKATTSSSARWYLVPHAGFAYGAKEIPNQYRVGADVLYGLRPGVELGGTVELGFRELVLVAIGPTLVYRWGRMAGFPLRPALYGGLSAFITSDNNQNDVLFGPRFGGVLSYGLNDAIELTVRFGADVLLVGSDRVPIPLVGALGVKFEL
ncbi:MAG TPA: hypothetical protein VI895_11125 [Bdellovibrionota bacterium]|nr:hypothetical protein [Bdellovibrionota bacterium]